MFTLSPWSRRLAVVACALLLAACGAKSPEEHLKAAAGYAAKGDISAAVIEARNAAQQAPENGVVRLQLGQLLLRQRDFLTAEKELQRALELRQPLEAVVPPLARVMNELGRSEKVISQFGSTKLSDPAAEAERLVQLAVAHLRLRNVKEAREAYKAASAAKPDLPRARLGVAQLALMDGKHDEALQLVEAIVEGAPGFAEGHAFLAEMAGAKGDRTAAKAAWARALAADQAFVDARYALAVMAMQDKAFDEAAKHLDAARSYARGDLRVVYLDAMLAYYRGDIEKARSAISNVLKFAPDHVPALVLAGTIELRGRRPVLAEEHLRKAFARSPEYVPARRMLATALLANGDSQRATEVLAPLLTKDQPMDSKLLMLAGEIAVARGDMQQASAFFESASSLDKKAASPRTRHAQIALASGRRDQAISELEGAAALDPTESQADMTLIMTHLRAKENDKALEAAQSFAKKQPNNPVAQQMLGVVQATRGDVAAARTHFTKALELEPSYLPAAVALAKLDVADKKLDDARKRLEGVIAYNDKHKRSDRNAEALLALAELNSRTFGKPADIVATLQRAVKANPQLAEAHLALIDYLLRQKDAKGAAAAAQEAAAALPKEPRIIDALATAQEATNQREQAIQTLNKLAALQPSSPRPLRRLAGVHQRAKQYDKSIEALERARKIAPQDMTITRDLMLVYSWAGKTDLAIKESRNLQQAQPNAAYGYEMEAEIWATQKKWAEAEKALRAGLRAEPSSTSSAAKLHTVLWQSGRTADAQAFAKKWLEDKPKDVRMWTYLGEDALKRKDYKSAAEHLEAAAALEPDAVQNAVTLNNLAFAQGQTGDPRAIETGERALRLVPNSADINDTLGTLYLKKGDGARAMEYFDKAKKLAPNRLDLRMNYAKALATTGKKDAARKEFEALQGEKADFRGKSEIPELLKTL